MKSPLSLLFFLYLTSAAPIPILLPADCQNFDACQPALSVGLRPSTPPTMLSNPHFPSHQLTSPATTANHHASEETFNNAPITPPKTVSPSRALGAAVPLESTYLQSLAGPSSTAANSLAAKPTSSLPHLRKEDELRYWASLLSGASKEEAEEHHKPVTAFVNCVEHLQPVSYTGIGQPKFMTREYSDLLVVGIVVLFLAAVIVLEAMEKFGDLRATICGRRQQRGQIYLEDDETIAYVVKKSFILGVAPKPKYKISVSEKEYADEDSDTGEFHYDSDAYMKV